MAKSRPHCGFRHAAPARLRAWAAVAVGATLLAGCASSPAPTAPATTAPRATVVTAAGATDGAMASRVTTTLAMEASCPAAGYPFVSLLTGFGDWSTVVGRIASPASPTTSKLVPESESSAAMIYGEFSAAIDTPLHGPALAGHVPLSFRGGRAGDIVTDIDTHSQSGWAQDGAFLGLIRSDNEAPTGWIADTLPIVDNRVVFPGVTCFEPAGLSDVDRRQVSVLAFD